MSWDSLVAEPCVKLSVTPKVHQIGDQLSDYFEEPLVPQGEGLGMTSDQTIEHMHSYIRKVFRTSGYFQHTATTKASARKQHQGILRINALSVRFKK